METHEMEKEDLTFRIRAFVYEVFRVLGAGFLEQVYQQALLHELEVQGLRAEGQRALEVTYKGKPVGLYIADILVEDCVVLELCVSVADWILSAELMEEFFEQQDKIRESE